MDNVYLIAAAWMGLALVASLATGLTFGTIAALFGPVILSAVVPTFIATTFFEPQPQPQTAIEREEVEAAEGIDADLRSHRRARPLDGTGEGQEAETA